MKESKTTSPWVLFGINNNAYAISCESVLSLNQMSTTTPVPKTPKEVRGVIKFREKMIQLLDTRLLLNLKSIIEEIEEFNQLMDQRFEDHKNWVKTLEESILMDTEFTLTTDPHQCAFGKWYDSYNLKNATILFSSAFAKFDKPHKAIHQIGITARNLLTSGKKDEAVELIKKGRETELKQMFGLFDELKEAYKESRRETVLVIGNETKCVGLAVDKIIAIEHLFEIDEVTLKESLTKAEILAGTAKTKQDGLVCMINDDFIVQKYH